MEGEPELLFSCPCCQYKTLAERGEYSICRVCFWEDDGNNNLDAYSHVNHMTLAEGRQNFNEFGAVQQKFSDKVEKERSKYHREF